MSRVMSASAWPNSLSGGWEPGNRLRSPCISVQNASSLSVSPTGWYTPERNGAKPFRSPLWAKIQCRPQSSRMNGWQFSSSTVPCVALRIWEMTFFDLIG
ncbi:hypothetical protein D3C87_1302940 [compost metagenome]